MNSDKKRPMLIAMYLPQYHEIEENNRFWGKGFTDWDCVKKSVPLFKGHNQPNVPLNDNYYDLSNPDSIKWQVDLARNNGIGGFAFYHYWFSKDQNLLTKPSEIFLANKDFDIDFMFAWDNISWKRTWSNVKGNDWAPLADVYQNANAENKDILIEYIIGNENEWREHYEYLSPFFLDKRYIKKDNKPVFLIWHPSDQIIKMVSFWNELAKKDGWDGVFVIYKYNWIEKYYPNEHYFFYEPVCSGWNSISQRVKSRIHKRLSTFVNKPELYSYDIIWKRIIRQAKKNKENFYSGAFIKYDDTPRRGKAGKVVEGANPRKFQKNMSKLISITKKNCKDFIFLTAWNEWGEGAYFEPDNVNGLSYLEVIRDLKGF